MEPIRSENKTVYVAVTVDGDLRIGDHHQREASSLAMRKIHAEMGLKGKVTWFINEYDFHWTENFPDLLLEIYTSGDGLGVHDHFDTQYAETIEEILPIAEESKRNIEEYFQSRGYSLRIEMHRNGCALQSFEIYSVLKRLGYRILSDVRPETEWSARMISAGNRIMPWKCLVDPAQGAVSVDNRNVPLESTPWLHDADNWLKYKNKFGHFLQVPITTMPWIDQERIRASIEASASPSWIVIDTHPYDLQDPKTGDVDRSLVEKYKTQLNWLQVSFQPIFIPMDRIPAILGLNWEDKELSKTR